MKIAINSIISRPVGPNTFGGTEGFTYLLTEELHKREHEIHLYASSDSTTSAVLHGVNTAPEARQKHMGELLSQPLYVRLAQQLALDAEDYDLIHNNYFHYYFFSAFAPFVSRPIVHTIHNAFFQDEKWREVLQSFPRGKNEHFVFVSEYAQKLSGFTEGSSVIHHGIMTDDFPYQANPSETFLWLGRMIPEKGADQAAQAAKDSGISLILNTARDAKTDEAYFREQVLPLLSESIHWEHEDQFAQKVRLYQNAKALFFPIMWEEPFGLVMLEAMSCGTPVIAYARGSVPEIIRDGVTGFIVNPPGEERGDFIIKKSGVEGLKEAAEMIVSLSHEDYQRLREECRKQVVDKFSIKRMIDDYEALYERVVSA
jgi:glycosyltransferase involved in cell wall biosynthesis